MRIYYFLFSLFFVSQNLYCGSTTNKSHTMQSFFNSIFGIDEQFEYLYECYESFLSILSDFNKLLSRKGISDNENPETQVQRTPVILNKEMHEQFIHYKNTIFNSNNNKSGRNLEESTEEQITSLAYQEFMNWYNLIETEYKPINHTRLYDR
jgi:hypothetical protein